MIMSFCKKSVHTFLGLTNTTNNNKNGLGLVKATVDDAYIAPTKPPSPPPPPPASLLFSFISKKDPRGIGFIDDMGGGVDGLMSCTESLGFESSDERIDHHMEMDMDARTNNYQALSKARWKKDNNDHHHEVKKFPPPLSSFNRNGQPSFFLRSVRSDGRLELTEFRIDRPEILRASREDGRLRLHLIRGDEVDIDREYNDEQDEEEEEDEDDEQTLEEEEDDDDDDETLEEEEEDDDDEKERVGEWKLGGFRRCNEMMGHRHQHNHLHVWSQQCVPTR